MVPMIRNYFTRLNCRTKRCIVCYSDQLTTHGTMNARAYLENVSFLELDLLLDSEPLE